jgi:asparagine synthase (glutamine-hydrolysing)
VYLKAQNKKLFDSCFLHSIEKNKSNVINIKKSGSLNESMYTDIVGGSLEKMLLCADRSSMANGIEVRTPFIDHRLVEYMFSIHENLKIKDFVTKYIQRKAFKKYLPDKILNRKDKIGFTAPQEEYMQSKAMVDYTNQAIKTLKERGILNKNYTIDNKSNRMNTGLNWRIINIAMLLRSNVYKAQKFKIEQIRHF